MQQDDQFLVPFEVSGNSIESLQLNSGPWFESLPHRIKLP